MEALVIIDVQNDYFPGGKNQLVGSEDAVNHIKIVLEKAREIGMCVIHVQHFNCPIDQLKFVHKDKNSLEKIAVAAKSVKENKTGFFLPGTKGVEIHEKVAPLNNEKIVKKNFPNSFLKTDLLAYIKENEISKLVVCGMMTHMCIDTTVRAAFDYQIPVTLLSDCVATKNLSEDMTADIVNQTFLLSFDGVFAQVRTSSEYLNARLKFIK
ncbi:MAG: cysteine hydrolase family protein [Mycoplasmatales bacterium]